MMICRTCRASSHSTMKEILEGCIEQEQSADMGGNGAVVYRNLWSAVKMHLPELFLAVHQS